jgi:hypothetical protein
MNANLYSFLGGILFTLISLPTLLWLMANRAAQRVRETFPEDATNATGVVATPNVPAERMRVDVALPESAPTDLRPMIPELPPPITARISFDEGRTVTEVTLDFLTGTVTGIPSGSVPTLVRTMRKDGQYRHVKWHKKNYLIINTNTKVHCPTGLDLERVYSCLLAKRVWEHPASFFSRFLCYLKQTPKFHTKILRLLSRKIQSLKLPKFGVKNLDAKEIELGTAIPKTSNFQDLPGTGSFVCDLSYESENMIITIALEITIPVKIPVVVTVLVRKFSGRVQMMINPPPSKVMWVTFLTQPEVVLDVKHQIQNHTVSKIVDPIIENVPLVAQAVADGIHAKLLKEIVFPNWDYYPLPDMEDTPPMTPHGGEMDEIHAEAKPGFIGSLVRAAAPTHTFDAPTHTTMDAFEMRKL